MEEFKKKKTSLFNWLMKVAVFIYCMIFVFCFCDLLNMVVWKIFATVTFDIFF